MTERTQKTQYSTFGRHVVIDTWGSEIDLLNNAMLLQQYMVKAATLGKLQVISVQSHQFSPQGATVLVLLSESHFSIHTYPEKKFAAIDCYTCGEKTDPLAAIRYLLTFLKPEKIYIKKFIRGIEKVEDWEYELNRTFRDYD